MRKAYSNPSMSLLRYVEADKIGTTSAVVGNQTSEADAKTAKTSVTVDMETVKGWGLE